jgi:hypothetical protein
VVPVPELWRPVLAQDSFAEGEEVTKDLEQHLWARLQHEPGEEGPFPRDVISKMIVDGKISSAKPAWRTLEKWAAEGVYNYGVSLDLGWKEPGRLPKRFS